MRFKDLRVALDAHLAGYSIDVQLVKIRSIPRNRSAQEKRARALAKAKNARGVIWLDIRHNTVSMIFGDEQGNERKLRRPFSCDSSNVAVCGDAIASLVNSAILSWTGHTFSKKQNQDKEATPVEDNELSPIPLNNWPWKRPESKVYLLGNVGYGFQFFKGSQSFTHGLHLGIGGVFIKYIALEISTDFLLPVEADSKIPQKSRIALTSLPLKIMAGFVLPIDHLSLGISFGLGLNFIGYHTITDRWFSNGVDAVIPGFASTLYARYTILEWLAAWVDFGIDSYGSSVEYLDSDPYDKEITLLRYGAVQGRVTIGLAVFFGVGQ